MHIHLWEIRTVNVTHAHIPKRPLGQTHLLLACPKEGTRQVVTFLMKLRIRSACIHLPWISRSYPPLFHLPPSLMIHHQHSPSLCVPRDSTSLQGNRVPKFILSHPSVDISACSQAEKTPVFRPFFPWHVWGGSGKDMKANEGSKQNILFHDSILKKKVIVCAYKYTISVPFHESWPAMQEMLKRNSLIDSTGHELLELDKNRRPLVCTE